MGIKIILFDLDDTLIIEEESADKALIATSSILKDKHNIDPVEFTITLRKEARKLWHSLPTHDYAKQISVSSWEALWARFTGDHPKQKELFSIRKEYQFVAWNNTLKLFNINNDSLAEVLSKIFQKERRLIHELYPDTIEVLDKLKQNYKLGLITNGTPDLQWEKIKGGNLQNYFEKIVIAGDINISKPDTRIFQITIDYFNESLDSFVFIGDKIKTDIKGANEAGIKSVWLNRNNSVNEMGIEPDYEIKNLKEIFKVLSA